jgi:hypothetical protein
MVAQPRPVLREICHSNDPAIAHGHALLRRTFHQTEVVGPSEWRNSLREREAGLWSDTRWHLVIAELRGVVIGMASGTYLGNVNTGVIGYLAVSSVARGSGVGPRLRSKLRTLFRRDAQAIRRRPLQAIIGEVRRDNPWLKTLVRRDHVLALDFEYFQPHLRRGAPPVPLVLYYESLGGARHRLSSVLIQKLLFTTWRRVYRIARPLAHATFRRMLEELKGRKFVGRLTPADLPALAGDSPG